MIGKAIPTFYPYDPASRSLSKIEKDDEDNNCKGGSSPGSPSPYIRLLYGLHKKDMRSRNLRGSSPAWEQTFIYCIQNPSTISPMLHLEIMDHRWTSKDKLLSRVSIANIHEYLNQCPWKRSKYLRLPIFEPTCTQKTYLDGVKRHQVMGKLIVRFSFEKKVEASLGDGTSVDCTFFPMKNGKHRSAHYASAAPCESFEANYSYSESHAGEYAGTTINLVYTGSGI
ncbi:hypothetical protein R1flu_000652 [Riccia fluitans]|uniref:C2 domain-containing protein n=1 Tax=Riccia fluitans TaxID=41844 RepID=A0ABD1Y473_9MARC